MWVETSPVFDDYQVGTSGLVRKRGASIVIIVIIIMVYPLTWLFPSLDFSTVSD
jgi:hypothetical protein